MTLSPDLKNDCQPHGVSPSSGRTTPVRLAVSAKYYEFPEKFIWLKGAGFDLEYTPDGADLECLPKHVDPFLSRGVAIRHHAFFPGQEIGNRNAHAAKQAMDLHFRMIDLIQGRGEPVVTVHIGLVPDIGIDHRRAVENLTRLVRYARNHGITVSLENLKHGPTSDPGTVLDWTAHSGAAITLDIGHAVSCDLVQKGTLDVDRIIDIFSDRLIEVHYYERETHHHHAPKDMSVLGPVVDRLQTLDCRWWTIELESREEILHTRHLLLNYLGKNSAKYFWKD